jgi:hypothetical protein
MADTIAPTEAQIALAGYDRMLAETRKFSAEQNKLASEQTKLQAEARKFDRERWVVLAGGIGGIIAAITGVVSLLKLTGWM